MKFIFKSTAAQLKMSNEELIEYKKQRALYSRQRYRERRLAHLQNLENYCNETGCALPTKEMQSLTRIRKKLATPADVDLPIHRAVYKNFSNEESAELHKHASRELWKQQATKSQYCLIIKHYLTAYQYRILAPHLLTEKELEKITWKLRITGKMN